MKTNNKTKNMRAAFFGKHRVQLPSFIPGSTSAVRMPDNRASRPIGSRLDDTMLAQYERETSADSAPLTKPVGAVVPEAVASIVTPVYDQKPNLDGHKRVRKPVSVESLGVDVSANSEPKPKPARKSRSDKGTTVGLSGDEEAIPARKRTPKAKPSTAEATARKQSLRKLKGMS